eukprot:2810635-Pyramimonas_sp.AAC.1
MNAELDPCSFGANVAQAGLPCTQCLRRRGAFKCHRRSNTYAYIFFFPKSGHLCAQKDASRRL